MDKDAERVRRILLEAIKQQRLLASAFSEMGMNPSPFLRESVRLIARLEQVSERFEDEQ